MEKHHRNWRYVFTLLWLTLLHLGSLSAQVAQSGMVLEYHGTDPKSPLEGVTVAAAGAAAVMSDNKGEFTLSFRTLHAGDAIQLRRVERSGYEVMNQEALENARVANVNLNLNPNPDPLRASARVTNGNNPNPISLTIILAKREVLRQLRDGYRSVAAQRYERQLKASEAEIEKLKQEGKLAEEQYNERMNALEEEYEEKLSKLESYIDKFARIDLSDLDQDEQQIIDLVQAGQFDEALALYDKQNLAERLRQSREDQQKLVAMRDQLSTAVQEKAIENQRLRQSIERQVTLLYMAGGEENMLKAHHILHETFLADTTHVDARREYALSLKMLGHIAESLPVLIMGEKTEKDPYSRGMLMGEIMRTLWRLDRSDEAYRYAMAMDSLMTPLAEGNYRVLARALPAWSEIQLAYYSLHEDLSRCESVVKRVRDQWMPDTLNHNSVKSYLYLLPKLSEYYSRVGDHQQMLWCVREMVELGETEMRLDPSRDDLGETFVTAASTYSLEGMSDELLCSARQCVVWLEKRIEKRGTRTVLEETAVNYYQLLYALVSAEEYALADSIVSTAAYKTAVDQALRSKEEYPRMYVGLLQWLESRLRLENGEMEEAESRAEKSLTLLESTEDGVELAAYMRPEIESRIALKRKDYKSALKLCQQAVGIHRDTYKESQDRWDADELCRSYLLLAEIYHASGNKGKARKMLKEAESVAFFPCNLRAIKNMNDQVK